MEINIQFVKMPTSEHMEAFVLKELEKLDKKYEMIIKTEVFFKFQKDPKGKGYNCYWILYNKNGSCPCSNCLVNGLR